MLKRVDVGYALVSNEQNQVLMVKNRQGTWSFPGGARETHETLKETILRECLEEAHAEVEIITIASVSELIKSDVHALLFVFKAKLISIKQRQPDEEIEEVAWISKEKANSLMPWYPNGVDALLTTNGAIYFI
jgi:8-oxo-dGTP diphosphatase